MTVLPVLGTPLQWHPAFLVVAALAVSPGAHVLLSALLERRRVRWRDDYAAVLVGDPLLAVAAGLGAQLSQPAGIHGWPSSWQAGLCWLAGGWAFGLWQSRHEYRSGRYTRGQTLSPTKLWHQFAVYPLLGYWVSAAVWSGLGAVRDPAQLGTAAAVLGCVVIWAVLAVHAIRHPKLGHGTLRRTRRPGDRSSPQPGAGRPGGELLQQDPG